MGGRQEIRDVRVTTGIRTVTTGLQICSGKQATALNNEIGPRRDHPLNVLITRKIAILESCLDLIECLSAGKIIYVTNGKLEMRIRRAIATSRLASSAWIKSLLSSSTPHHPSSPTAHIIHLPLYHERIRTQQNNRIGLPIVATEVDRILFQIKKIEDLAKNVVDPPVIWI
ncbi:hypothetical protein BYT27DRAFT_7207227 [Phlegmacium glaucopus]|nr:hypothetical protein BYT27DRAFT_7207227 [Phlegmacium glaucopus]